ncbi:SDR family NAD(P)-dependent oxidoreductase [Candidatus Pelagibacter sp. HIMB1495]|uniref:SDR family NAD(P)-dependent oxidoreductase n=1 Tax=unclassified Candidatus Pelagibacter TaxID=2647897 RepID=UPI003F8365C3
MKRIIITGATGSIGNEIVKYFYKSNELICIDINKKELKILKNKFKKIKIYECDITNQKKVDELFKKLNLKFKYFDILINNAGKIYNQPIVKLTTSGFKSHNYKIWKNILDLNLNSVFLFSSKIIENFCNNRTGGLIINISSISAKGNIGQSAYSVAKSGIEILTKIWAQELSNLNIRVACIAPGFLNTRSTYKSLSKFQIDHLKNITPIKRLGNTKELILAIKFIINNKFFNGKVLSLDGGLEI